MNGALDLTGSNAFAAAAHWLQATLLGSLATIVAIIAVATIGLLLLAGRIHTRRAVRVILGCFIIFGASSIAAGITAALRGGGGGVPEATAAPPPPPTLPAVPAQADNAAAWDPYAGAALPARR